MALGAAVLAAFRSKSWPSTTRSGPSTSPEPEPEPEPEPRKPEPVPVPSFFLCPITYEIMADPVTLDTGMTYDRASIEEWLEHGHNTCPSTNRILLTPHLIPNLTLHRAIRAWCAANRSSSNVDAVSELLEVISQCNEVGAFYDCAKEIYTVAEESGRTRRTLRDLGAIGIVTRAVVRLDEIITEKRSRSWNKGLEYAIATIAMLHPSGEADKCWYEAHTELSFHNL